MTTTPTLAMPNFNEPFIIESDASGDSIGAILSQQGRPIAFMSRALGTTKWSWSTYAREMLAIIQAIQTWRPYFLGRKFYIHIDQRSLKYLLEQRITTLEQQKWVAKLLGYDYEITYKPGRVNTAADALSRVSGSPCLDALFVSQTPLWDIIKTEARDHPYMQKISTLATQQAGTPYTWRHGLVHYKNRVVIPPNSSVITHILHEFHDSPMGGAFWCTQNIQEVSTTILLAIHVPSSERLCCLLRRMPTNESLNFISCWTSTTTAYPMSSLG